MLTLSESLSISQSDNETVVLDAVDLKFAGSAEQVRRCSATTQIVESGFLGA